MSKLKKTAASVIALVLAASLTFPAMADLNTSSDGQQASEKQNQYSIITRHDTILSTGRPWMEWDEEQKQQHINGIANLLTVEDLKAADPDVKILENDGMIYSISGSNLPMKAADEQEALYAAYTLAGILGFPEDIDLWFLSEIHPSDNSRIYLFEQEYEGKSVPGSTIKVVTDEKGQVTAVFNSLYKEMPESTGDIVIDEAQAQKCVEEHLKKSGETETVLPGYITPVMMVQEEDMSDPSNEILPELLYWVVMAEGSEDPEVYPYTAHYVCATGEWQFSIPVHSLEDENILAGNNSTCVLDNMESAEWSGTVTYGNGNTAQITVPVMYDKVADTYCLGDVERRIAVGEYYDFFFEDKELILVSSKDNTGWNNDDLITYYNYIKSWDFYNEMGWKGPDGSGTPSLLLRNMCTKDKEPYDNAAYFSYCRGWQLFAYDNSSYYFGEALDVMAHEFTHCVTTTLQGANLYLDDKGAINEAMSDIMGNICETELEADEENGWMLGEDSAMAIRSMSDPHKYNQPEYVWDIFYSPHAYKPNDMNDRGGVHANSSILNLLAAKLFLEAKMSTADMKNFWMMTACGITPETDYYQMADVLQWAVRTTGYGRYEDVLNKYIEEGQFRRTQIPDKMEQGRVLASLTLPDTPDLSDEYWVLAGIQIEMPSILDIIKMLGMLMLSDPDAEDESAFGETLAAFAKQYTTWVSDDTRTMKMIQEDRQTIYMLINMDPDTFEVRGLAVFSGTFWIDLMSLIDDVDITDDVKVDEDSLGDAALEILMGLFNGGAGIIKDLLSSVISGGDSGKEASSTQYIEIPTIGLENIKLHEPPAEEEEALDIAA